MKIFITLFILLFSVQLFAQSRTVVDKPAITRKVSGIVKDAFENPVNNAKIALYSKSDTLKTITYLDGKFFFDKVKQQTFVIQADGEGYVPVAFRYYDTAKVIVLNPIKLRKIITSQQVSGIIKNGANKPIIGATITLTSVSDSLRAVTDNDGTFIFDQVTQPVFTLTAKSEHYLPFISKYKNDNFYAFVKKFELSPIILKSL